MLLHKISVLYVQNLHPTIEDIYEVLIENEQSVKEKVRIFDTAGLVRVLQCMYHK